MIWIVHTLMAPRPRATSPRPTWLLAAATLLAAAAGCGTDARDLAPSATTDQDIEGGVSATSATLNAIGAIARINNGSFAEFATGTLISPTMVLTSKHNLLSITDLSQVRFLIGPDASAPIRAVAARGFAVEPTVTGGLLDDGSDVGILHLATPVTDIPPLPVAALTDARIGTRMVGLGFGDQNDEGLRGTRRAGSMTLQATSGSALAAAFGTFDNFLTNGGDALPPGVDPTDPANRAFLQQIFDTQLLLPGIEAWIGGAPDDAMACTGDGGGPVTARVGTQLTVFGVSSWGFGVVGTCQPIGSAYASMNPISLDFIDYETHCPLVPRAGTCEGTVAVRCAAPDEGGRRVVRTDCADLGQVCGFDATGALGCIDPP